MGRWMLLLVLWLPAVARADERQSQRFDSLKELWEPALENKLDSKTWVSACLSMTGCAGDCEVTLSHLASSFFNPEVPACARLRSQLGGDLPVTTQRRRAGDWARARLREQALAVRNRSAEVRDLVDCTLALTHLGAPNDAACKRCDERQIMGTLRSLYLPITEHITLACATTLGCAPGCQYRLASYRQATCPALDDRPGESKAEWEARRDAFARQHLIDYVRQIAPLLDAAEVAELRAVWSRLQLGDIP